VAHSLYKLAQPLILIPGKLAESETNILEALAIQKKVLGDHRDTAATLIFLGMIREQQQRPIEAEAIYQEALEMQRKVLGDHAGADGALYGLASALQHQRRFAEAEARYREAFDASRKFFGDEFGETQSAKEGLVAVLLAQGKVAEAK